MELQHLRYFVDMAYQESISKAAEMNHIAQPAMSRTLAVLEKELGTPLFDRVGRNIRLNECGKILLEAAEQSLSILDGVPEKIDFCNNQISGKVKICVCAYLRDFEGLCEKFAKEHPLVDLDVQNKMPENELHLNSRYDLFIYMGPVKYEGTYDTKTLDSHKLIAKVRSEHPLAVQDQISALQLSDQELVIPRHVALRDIIYSYCYRLGFVPHVAGEVSLHDGQKLLLDTAPKKRVLLLLREVDGQEQAGYRVLPLADPPCVVDINMAWSKSSSLRPSVAAFRDYILKFYTDTDGEEKRNRNL